jgi:hypothetical protein
LKRDLKEFQMDIVVTPTGSGAWSLVDLLGRHMGIVEETAPHEYRIEPDNRVGDAMRAMKRGPFPTLDRALAEIETFTRSTCRMAPIAEAEKER